MSFGTRSAIPVTMSHSHFYNVIESFPHLEEEKHHHHKDGHHVDEFFDHKEKVMKDLRADLILAATKPKLV
jgi:hypothetical protein